MLESQAYKTYLDYTTGKVIPKEARKRTKAHMKETSLTADVNIIPDDPDAALELAKSISRTEAEEQEATRLVNETHECLVTKQPTKKRRQTGVTIRDTPAVTKKKTPKQPLKLKGMEMLSDAAILVVDTKKAIKASKHDFRSQHQAGSSSEGAGLKPEVPDESKGKTKDTNKGGGLKPQVPDGSKTMSSNQESKNESWGESEEEDDDDRESDDERTKSDDDKSIDLNNTNDKEEAQEDEFIHTPDDYVPTDDETQDVNDEEYVCIHEDLYGDVNVEMKDVEPVDKDKGDEEMTDAEKVDAEHKEIYQEVASAKVQDEAQATTTTAPSTQKEKTMAPPSSSSCSVSSNYVLTVPVSVIPEPTALSSIPEIVTAAPATTIPPPIPPFIPHSQQSTPISTPTTTETITSTPAVPDSETLSVIHLCYTY
ncbi:hypothetical protein Tco_0599924 [Tanacetum coccineum]